MAGLPEPIVVLAAFLGKLPGIGPRSAERIALHVAQADLASIRDLAAALVDARNKVQACGVCGALTEAQPCPICADSRRDDSLICVVEKPVDVISLSKSSSFQGKFHVLGGKLSPINGVEPEDLGIAQLQERLAQNAGKVREIILALPSDVEGDATSHYLSQMFAGKGVKISRIAQGLPVGSGLEFADELTLSRALEGRREF